MTAPENVHAHAQSRDVLTRKTIEGNSAPIQNVEHNDHGSKTLATIALVIACVLPSLTLGVVGTYILMASQNIDNKIVAGVAHAEAEANEAKVKARVAEDSVKSICAALKAAKVPNVDCH